MKNRPYTTLFLLVSVDGKITTGDSNELDVDKDFPRMMGIKEGLQQYYDLEKQTDRVSLNSGRVQAKVGVNERIWNKKRENVSFVIVDNKPHLNKSGTEYFARRSVNFYLVTTNKNHPAFDLQQSYPKMHILYYEDKINFVDVFHRLKKEFDIDRITIQTGGTLNAEFLRLGLIDQISIVVAPCLIGGKNTQGLIGGDSLHTEKDLTKIKALKLIKCDILENSYLYLQYKVINHTVIT